MVSGVRYHELLARLMTPAETFSDDENRKMLETMQSADDSSEDAGVSGLLKRIEACGVRPRVSIAAGYVMQIDRMILFDYWKLVENASVYHSS